MLDTGSEIHIQSIDVVFSDLDITRVNPHSDSDVIHPGILCKSNRETNGIARRSKG